MPATAFAPGSVTTVFAPQEEGASLGVSFATADGVTATVTPATSTTVVLDGAETSVEPVAGVLDRLEAPATVRLDTALPIGCGFGVSGAATLATAMAMNAAAELGHDRATLVEQAHRAEVAAGTGLGDVFIQNQGGLVWDRGNGLQRAECAEPISYVSFGGIPTADVLGNADAVERVTTVGKEVLSILNPEEGVRPLLQAAWGFATRIGLTTDRVDDAVRRVQKAGGVATMAMVGETVIASGAPGTLSKTTRITRCGAELR